MPCNTENTKQKGLIMIRKTVLLIAAVMFLSISQGQAATLIESKDRQGTLTKMWIEGSMMRVDINNESSYMLFDVKNKKMYAVDPEKREAMDMSHLFNEDRKNVLGRPEYKFKFDMMGKGPVIAGYNTLHFQSSANGMKCADEYLSKKAFDDIASLEIFEALSKMAESAQSGMRMGMGTQDPCESLDENAMGNYKKHGYPLKMVEKDGSVDSEVIRISLDVAKPKKDFQVPGGYEVINLEQMMNEQMKYMPQQGNNQATPQMKGMENQEMDPAEMQLMLEQMMKNMEREKK
jgi:hypothetical protein